MTLHEAIEKLLLQVRTSMTTTELADELNKNKWYQKKDGSKISAFQIFGRTRNYSNIFTLQGSIVLFVNEKHIHIPSITDIKTNGAKKSKQSDECYIINICDKILGLTSSRQHRFEFLLGDPNLKGISVRLPVDAYYEKLNLIIEYKEIQHTESVGFFDKPTNITVSGVHRGEQRKIYDERRCKVITENGMKLIEISYSDFKYDRQKRIIRDEKTDTEKIMDIFKNKAIVKFM